MNVTQARKALAKALANKKTKGKKLKTTKKPKARKPTVARLAQEEKLALRRYEKAYVARRTHLKLEQARLVREFHAAGIAGVDWNMEKGGKNIMSKNNQVTVYEPSSDSGSCSDSESDTDSE
jgi:hypothetical protein